MSDLHKSALTQYICILVIMDPQAVKAEMFQAIFTNCDANNLGQVAPSVVIDYIKPFFQEEL